MCTLFVNLYKLYTWGPHTVYHGEPMYFIFIRSNVVGWVCFIRIIQMHFNKVYLNNLHMNIICSYSLSQNDRN